MSRLVDEVTSVDWFNDYFFSAELLIEPSYYILDSLG
jgi:hypothetical protein